jgi:hypothetical protein
LTKIILLVVCLIEDAKYLDKQVVAQSSGHAEAKFNTGSKVLFCFISVVGNLVQSYIELQTTN